MSGMSEREAEYKRALWLTYRCCDEPGRKVIMKAILDTEV